MAIAGKNNSSGINPNNGITDQFITDGQGRQQIVVSGATAVPTTDAADGLNGSPAPLYSIQNGAQDGSGNLQPLQVDSTKALKTSNIGASLNATAQVSVTSSGVQIIGANAARAGFHLVNTSSTLPIYYGKSGVTTSTGAYLPPLTAIWLPFVNAIFGIVPSTSVTVTTAEVV